jgi:PII-like signaling protein
LAKDKHAGKPLYEWIVVQAQAGLWGATVLRGLMGYGAASRIHTAKIEVSQMICLIVELVDTRENWKRLCPSRRRDSGWLATLKSQIRFYRTRHK